MRPLNALQQRALENLVDQCSLHQVLFALAEIATRKAEHISLNWQDQTLAGAWVNHDHEKWTGISERVEMAAQVAQKGNL